MPCSLSPPPPQSGDIISSNDGRCCAEDQAAPDCDQQPLSAPTCQDCVSHQNCCSRCFSLTAIYLNVLSQWCCCSLCGLLPGMATAVAA